MSVRWLAIPALAALTSCATVPPARQAAPVEVKIIAFNDFHGALEPPKIGVPATAPGGAAVKVPAGGAAYFASAVARLRAANPNSITVSAGDLISASPFVSSQFLDEPTILAMNMIGLDLNAVGNHEFDRGPGELLRMQNGGCAKHTNRQPCRADANFPGARFRFLAANVRRQGGDTLFPATALRSFGKGAARVKVGFIGLTLKSTPTLVVPASVAGLSFEDEAATINAQVPRLKAQGADAIVVLIHQGLATKVDYNDKSCGGVSGDLLPILGKLDPAVDLVVSGHTHNAYVCDFRSMDPARPFLVTSAGRSGTMLTDIRLSIDPKSHRVSARAADNLIVQGEGFTTPSGETPIVPAFQSYAKDPRVDELVQRYVAAAAPISNRVVGRIAGQALRAQTPSGESVLGDLVADAQLRATGADIAFMNQYGLRADLVPASDGSVTYGQLYAVAPFGNVLQLKGLTGRQLRALLEQQFASGSNTVQKPNMLMVSRGFSYRYDLTKPEGQRIIDMQLNGVPIDEARTYRVSVSNFLATGGDNFTVLREGADLPGSSPEDIDAFEGLFGGGGVLALPEPNRVTRSDLPEKR
ncbi:bifunctional metallophosphatase/5'-nucleotidase [Sphingomonas sp. ID1715]|uniref:bifunctional metallophosphatase/5'-nucleotidase n=1 Tax=Sphingomonas sp. ID1715 TaxID=1656898 RepID=UPI001488E6FB|nr:bifunctional metallophosphatase/5'-nucleotidase [Sphingomonas sp. ID1715]NNM78639.1 bifunctional metallophosphatase/5'-nucleotidase [Sphingomonas sp. ID1715]